MSNKQWIIKSRNQTLADCIKGKFNIPPFLADVLSTRNFLDINDVETILNPRIENMYDPFMLNDMHKATIRIIHAINNKERILIYGDYDVDGVSSTSLLYNFLSTLTNTVDYFIPDRFEDGYGLTQDSAEKVLSLNPNLLITVDCGVASIDEIGFIQNSGIDVIVTDHHECRETLPPAVAVINPHRHDNSYPFQNLAGAGVTFKLVCALCKKLNLNTHNDYLDLAALGTVADVMPLVDENRIIVKYGLDKIVSNPSIGMKSLLDVCNVLPSKTTSYTLAFLLAPRINAAGRMGDASRGVKLFTTSDENEAKFLASQLHKENIARQETEQSILNEAIDKIESNNLNQNPVIVVAGDDWHHGVVGIVASRICEKYYRPTIVLSIEGDIARGSARSVCDFNIYEAILSCSNILDRFGGHEMAAGLTIKTDFIGIFSQDINNFSKQMLSDCSFIPKIFVDTELIIEDITLENINWLNKLQPFGNENESPLFQCSDLIISDIRAVGGDKHLKLKLQRKNQFFDAIGFNLGHLNSEYKIRDLVDIVCALEINEWNGKCSPQFRLVDIRPSQNLRIEEKFLNLIKSSASESKPIICNDDSEFPNHVKLPLSLDRAWIEQLYKLIKSKNKINCFNFNILELSDELSICNSSSKTVTTRLMLQILDELELISMDLQGCFADVSVNKNPTKTSLDNSSLYNYIINQSTHNS